MTEKSEFFTPIEFPTSGSADQKPKPKVVWDEAILSAAKKAIDVEMGKIRTGTSKLRAGAIDNGKFVTPCDNAIKVFLNDPNDELFQRIKDLSSQDYGQRVGDFFVSELKKARTEVPNG